MCIIQLFRQDRDVLATAEGRAEKMEHSIWIHLEPATFLSSLQQNENQSTGTDPAGPDRTGKKCSMYNSLYHFCDFIMEGT